MVSHIGLTTSWNSATACGRRNSAPQIFHSEISDSELRTRLHRVRRTLQVELCSLCCDVMIEARDVMNG